MARTWQALRAFQQLTGSTPFAYIRDVRLSEAAMALRDTGRSVLDVALDTGLPTYDAAYLWLAQSLRLPLATFDAAQMAAARKSGVTLLAPEDF